MNKLVLRNQKGFTIIEVVLVLAIAGLIFLTVFLALPAMQKSQRDNARKQDVGKVVAYLQSYLADNNRLPIMGSLSITGLAQSNSASMRGIPWGPETNTDLISVKPGCGCKDSGGTPSPWYYTVEGANYYYSKSASVMLGLENGVVYCKEI